MVPLAVSPRLILKLNASLKHKFKENIIQANLSKDPDPLNADQTPAYE